MSDRKPGVRALALAAAIAVWSAAAVPSLQSPSAGATVATQNATQKAYYAKTLAERQAIDAETSAPPTGERKTLIEDGTSFPLKTTFSWSGTGPFQLVIRRAADRAVFFSTNGLTATSLAVGNFEIGCRYVWSVANASGSSDERAFATESDGPRLLDGASEIFCTNVWAAGKSYEYKFSNPTPHGVRDIGGVTGLDGRRVRQGMIIRSSQLDSEYSASGTTSYVTDRNRAFWKEFIGIKTEIDLRNATESKLTASPLGPDVAYRRFPSMTAYAEYLQGTTVKNSVRDIVKLFADEANYPIDFHCVHGKDRTGALALILEGLLGCSEEHIARDYQATMFWNPLQASARFFALENYFRTNRYANASNVSLNEGIYNYVKKVGVTADEIDAFREIMLEPAAKRWTGKTVAVVGDSYSAWAGAAGVTNAYYPSSECGVTQESQMWWSQVIANYDGMPGVVAAGSGSRITEDCVSGGVPMGSFANRVKDGQLGDPDVILVLGGLNDWWHEVPTTDFYAACGSLFDTLDARYAKAEKIVQLSKLPDVWDVGIPDDYRRALRTAALAHGYTVVDLEGAYNASGNVKEGHPTALGMTNIAQRIVATLEGTYVAPELPPYVPPSGPETYDYLDSDGTGYLLADYPLDILKTHVELKFQLLEEQPEGNQSLFWVNNTTTGEEWGCTQWDKGGSIGYYYNAGSADVVDRLPDFQETHVIRVGGNTAQFDENAPTSGKEAAVAIAKSNIMLFASRHYASPYPIQYKARYRLYSFKIWEDDETQPVRHYVAAKNPDGVATLYDTVTGTYLDPSTGSFTVGNVQKIDVPAVHTEPFAYDSTLKRPIMAGDTYAIGADTAASVPGDYTVTVTPKGGFTWQDGTRTPKPFAWSIVGDFAMEVRDGGWETRATIGGQRYCILAYTNSAAWTVPEGVTNVEFLVVAGGGAGGASGAAKDYRSGGGGGAGGVVTGRVDVATGSTLTLTVGAGGAAVSAAGEQGTNGGDSGIANGAVNVVTVKGGGAGGCATSAGQAGSAGGCGGGGSSKNSSTGATNGGVATSPAVAAGVVFEAFGHDGGKGYGKSCAGGGGGAGGAGTSAANGVQGVGGAGIALCLSGEETVYAAGGDGGVENEVAGVAEAAGTGNGGDGAYRTSSKRYEPTSGGSGIVIIRYAVPSEPVGERIQQEVDAAKSGASVLPAGVSLGDVTVSADGTSFTYGEREYAKPHYVFETGGGTLVAVIAPSEAEITSVSADGADGTFVLGTVENSVKGFRYAVEYVDDLSQAAGDWTVGPSSSPGNGGRLILSAPKSPTHSERFYRMVVTDVTADSP